ncbi:MULTISPECIES: esterase/lipase family protein [Pseudomonas]|uniref:Putative lipase n=1 Tax=Pseudomonas brassicacearum (strain NFM421) TaxID=994484 RepID=F2KBN3_PSEBN|nr:MULTISPECIES: triacylglycerol lipase [Pseudomonas]EIK70339.1 triacylglycerol lipase [Pseudomonas fluorescens Q8r1-96]KIR19527.1 Lactonizing lipase precursor [Pseudomonas fluorescens]AEA66735.1 Putative lipase [Pseudomonas brassicacearum subsp. brassicacearum NFM421]ALQ01185.1 Lipase precursor [Pseudomonas brassicacearum]AOS39676.1 alpha/beta hydrolase [Pseudomonas brassicacearum]
MSQRCATRYPLVLVPGMLGFIRLVLYPYWYGIVSALRRGGAVVVAVKVSPLHSSEVRGEQLLARIEEVLRQTGAQKVNLIGHSQGSLTARYAAAKRPDLVASVTSVAGTNHGSELADYLQAHYPADSAKGRVLSAVLRLINALMSLLETGYRGPKLPVDIHASHASLTTAGVALFNQRYPQGLPQTWGGNGPEEVNGVRYYSWSGTLQPGKTDKGRNLFDGTNRSCRLFARTFVREAGQCDGMVGRYSSHLGTVIGDDYPLDHFDIVNQSLGLVGKGAEPIRLFVEHAERLKAAGV